jgi:hypothetical protein
MTAKTFDTTEYEFSHGHKPRGYGSWAFARPGSPAERGETFDGIEWRNGTYTDAKQQLPAGEWVVLP